MAVRAALVIDPESEIMDKLSKILTSPDWTLETASDNAAVLELLKTRRFDLIITGDKSSAHEDIELLRKIRKVHPHTEVIIVTDESAPTDVVAAMRAGAFSYFSRPFSVASLAEMVLRVVEGPCWDDGIEILSAKPEWIQIAARCEVNTADRLLQFIHEMIDLPESERNIIGSALRELLMNAIEYGGQFDPDKYVQMSYLRTKRSVACRIKDPGVGFSLDEIRHAAIMNPPEDPLRHLNYREAENKRPGGFGVLLARNSVDELIYSDKGNEVVLIKYVDQPQQAAY